MVRMACCPRCRVSKFWALWKNLFGRSAVLPLKLFINWSCTCIFIPCKLKTFSFLWCILHCNFCLFVTKIMLSSRLADCKNANITCCSLGSISRDMLKTTNQSVIFNERQIFLENILAKIKTDYPIVKL